MEDYVLIQKTGLTSKQNSGDETAALTYNEYMEYCYRSNIPYQQANTYFKKNKLPGLWSLYDRVVKPNGAILLFAQSPFDKKLALSNMKNYRYEWILEKTTSTGFLNSNRMPLKCHENILVFYKHLPVYHPQKTQGHPYKESKAESKLKCKQSEIYHDHAMVSYGSTERFPRDVIRVKTDKQKLCLHPTQKPVNTLEYYILTYSNEGDIVLDNTMGSGSTGVAALRTGRRFLGIEILDKYYEISSKWIQEEAVNWKKDLTNFSSETAKK